MTPIQFLAKDRGTFIVNKGSTKRGNFTAVEVLSASVIASILDVDNRTDVYPSYVADKTLSLPAGTIIKALPGKTFSSITLTSGAVQLILD